MNDWLEQARTGLAGAVGDAPAMEDKLAHWYARRPTVPKQNPFTLERMLCSTLEVYRELVGH